MLPAARFHKCGASKDKGEQLFLHMLLHQHVCLTEEARRHSLESNKAKQMYLSPHLGIQHKWIEGQCPLSLSPGLNYLCSMAQGSTGDWRKVAVVFPRSEKACGLDPPPREEKTKMPLLKEKQSLAQGFKRKNGGKKVKNIE